MASLLSSHLEQISLCAQSIADLPFPGPKMFTNALLSPSHDITSLIRDTEQHERALFHLAPPPMPNKVGTVDFGASSSLAQSTTGHGRRATVYQQRNPKNKAVAAVLGGDLYQKTRRNDLAGRQKGDIDVEVLLQGAEKLAAVYPISGAQDKITQLRRRHQQLEANITHYEALVAEQTKELQAMNRPSSRAGYDDGDDVEGGEVDNNDSENATIPLTKEDLEQEEVEIRELEKKRRGLEERVTGMERDLGGLMR